MEKSFLWFACQSEQAESTDFHKLRDAAALSELQAALAASGYAYNGFITNKKTVGPNEEAPFFGRLLEEIHLVAMTTRIPWDSEESRRTKQTRTGVWIENQFLPLYDRDFLICTRDIVQLAKVHTAKLSLVNRSYIRFREYRKGSRDCADYAELNRRPCDRSEEERTCGFLMFAPQLWDRGPDGLCSFGMTGNSTLAWNYLLKTELADKVSQIVTSTYSHFLMAEFSVKSPPDLFSTVGPNSVSLEKILVDHSNF